jgi:hypothetical protein
MIETDYFVITEEMYSEYKPEADELSVSLDYFFMEFMDFEYEWVDG